MRQLLFFLCLIIASHSSKSFVISALDDQIQQKLNNELPDQFLLERVIYRVDAACDLHELEYLTGLSDGSLATKKDLQNALFYLQQSAKFSAIDLELIKNIQSYDLIFHLKKEQILHRISVSGFLRGKDRLRNNYLIDIGESFDMQKHQYSIEQMVNFLQDHGYFKAEIFDSVKVDEMSKDVVVHCKVKKGRSFKVKSVNIVFDHVGWVSKQEIDKLQNRIEALCLAKLQGKSYRSVLLDTILKKIKWIMQRQGCIDFEVNVDKNIAHDDHQIDIIFKIGVERKKEFIFFGTKFFKADQILDHLLLYGKSTWHFPKALIVDEIEQLYKNKGFWNVAVSVKEEKDKVFCSIKEGPRAIISNIQFKNNLNISSQTLVNDACKPMLRSRYFDKDLFEKTLDQIIKIYKKAGFWDAKIVKDQFSLTEKDGKSGSYELMLTMHEGVQKTLGSIFVEGYPELQEELQQLYTKNIGQGFDSAWLQDQKQLIMKFFKTNQPPSDLIRGATPLKITTGYSLSQQDNIVTVVWKIEVLQQQVKMGKTIILGNCKVSHKLLMQERAHEDGQVWDKKNIEKTLQNFRGLPIFDAVQVYPGSQNDVNFCKPVFVKLVEDDRYEIKTRFGMQQVGRNLQLFRGFTYKAGATFCFKNPFFQADQCLLEGDMTRFYRNFSASYQFPWLFGRKIGTLLKAYDSYYQQPVYIGSQDCLYKITQQGFLSSVTNIRDHKKFGQFVLNGSLGFEVMGVYQGDQPDLNLIIDYDKKLLAKKIGYLFAEPTVLWQQVDNLLNPHHGHSSFFSCKGMFDLDSKTSFFKVLIEHTQYIPIGDKVTCAVRARMGHVFNRCFDQINPIERFYMGGALTLRGYERDYTPPYGLLTKPIYDQHAGLPACANNIWRYAPQGGRTMFNFNTEFRLNLYKNFGMVLFNDFGALFKYSLYDEMKSWRNNLFAGSGFGFRYDTPLGPARFDVGYKWKIEYKDFESRCVWYLTLGQAF